MKRRLLPAFIQYLKHEHIHINLSMKHLITVQQKVLNYTIHGVHQKIPYLEQIVNWKKLFRLNVTAESHLKQRIEKTCRSRSQKYYKNTLADVATN